MKVWEIRELLRICSKNSILKGGIRLHGVLVKMGLKSDVVTNNDLIDMYGKCGKTEVANQVFERMPEKNVVSWTVLISGYLYGGNPRKALKVFDRMCSSDVRPNEFTLSTVLKACCFVGVVENGVQIHGLCTKSGYESYPVVSNTLLHMYSRSGLIKEARKILDVMPVKSLISWNAMIGGYVTAGREREALFLFREMQKVLNVVADEFTYASILKACSCVGAFREGLQVHASVMTSGYVSSSGNEILTGALIDLYVKTRNLAEAKKVFDGCSLRNEIMWTTLIIGYSQEGLVMESMDLFSRLWRSGISIDGFVLSTVIGVFADFSMIEQGKQLHSYTHKVPSGDDVSVGNSIIDMYIKCGLTDEAEQKFREMPRRNVVSWTVMINGHGKHGNGHSAINLFEEMQKPKEDKSGGLQPDEVTNLAILSACSHSGLVEECWKYFTAMQHDNQTKLTVEHYACMVDLLGRAGKLKEARSFISNMPITPNAGTWQTLLSACRIHGDVDLGREVGDILLNIDGDNPVNYVMLSNIHAEGGGFEECARLRKMMKSKRLKKQGGCSWIEVEKRAEVFYGGDKWHPLTEKIHEVLKEVERRMKEENGYSCEVRFAMHDVDGESKEDVLRMHSEKLAVGLGLLVCGREGEVIRVYKNLRICGDCHEFMKGVSVVVKRVLVIRDANRFHRFENGNCSCGDYW